MNSPILVNDKQELLNHPATQVTKWWLPDDILFFTEIPKTSVENFSKKTIARIVRSWQTDRSPEGRSARDI